MKIDISEYIYNFKINKLIDVCKHKQNSNLIIIASY